MSDPVWDPKNPIAPFDDKGNLLHYPGWKAEWREAPTFEAVLRLQGSKRGRSAAYFEWADINTRVTYPMFMADIADLLTRGEVGRSITGRLLWSVRKRGANFGIALAKEQRS